MQTLAFTGFLQRLKDTCFPSKQRAPAAAEQQQGGQEEDAPEAADKGDASTLLALVLEAVLNSAQLLQQLQLRSYEDICQAAVETFTDLTLCAKSVKPSKKSGLLSGEWAGECTAARLSFLLAAWQVPASHACACPAPARPGAACSPWQAAPRAPLTTLTPVLRRRDQHSRIHSAGCTVLCWSWKRGRAGCLHLPQALPCYPGQCAQPVQAQRLRGGDCSRSCCRVCVWCAQVGRQAQQLAGPATHGCPACLRGCKGPAC